MLRVFKHIPCNGTGRIPNPDFEACRDRDSPIMDCRTCQQADPALYGACYQGEEIPCEGCGGSGNTCIDEDEWEEVK